MKLQLFHTTHADEVGYAVAVDAEFDSYPEAKAAEQAANQPALDDPEGHWSHAWRSIRIDPKQDPEGNLSGELRLRHTTKYVGDYSHLDRWDDLGLYLIVERFEEKWLPHYEPDMSEVPGDMLVVETAVPEGTDPDVVMDALADTLSFGGCACEHDCCGCMRCSVYPVIPHPYRDGAYYVHRSFSRNY